MINKLNLPWTVVHNYKNKIIIVDNTNNGKDVTSGRICSIARGKNERGEFIAKEICRMMNSRLTSLDC